ncbi:NmrA family NAD(P)-binding protein [Streptomyces griseocarneus]|uniref:NmrA family NAD(P)-binding protein n=1 Tax=Streptomyces griseocarneus TaxID=51201 RepID=UPI00167D35A7|nr:NmrA family NAD(P)-binding protein [Streptomyces griseocarneus]MBZ6474781.1 NmrA family NAD(P)-binding protein [Streptomyces griseocarneus]GHG48047.1 nucleotide-diphosphate-sugar epimerase [Streptomyces griseocarneus]
MHKILVTGATGNVGKHLVSSLAAAGFAVRALVRDPAGATLPDGVEAVRGDLSDPSTLGPALRGVESVYLMWPGIPVEPRTVEAVAGAARHVVYLSTDVTDLAEGEQATWYHQEIERLLRKSGTDWTFLRAIDFATNALAWAGQIREGVVSWPYGQAARSLIHERDIADVAAHVLTTPGHHGARYLITGPEAVTHAEQVRIIGEETGREVRWEELPPETARERLTAAWGNAEFVDGRLRAWASFAETPERVTDTVEQLLGRPARTFRSWARDHADDFRQ